MQANRTPATSKGTTRKTSATKTKATATKAKATTAKRKAAPKKGLSSLDAVAQVLTEKGGPARLLDVAREVVERKLAPGLKGKTPVATITAQVMGQTKKSDGRFVKVDRGVVDLRSRKG